MPLNVYIIADIHINYISIDKHLAPLKHTPTMLVFDLTISYLLLSIVFHLQSFYILVSLRVVALIYVSPIVLYIKKKTFKIWHL